MDKGLLPLLEDEPFWVVTQLGLRCSTDYKAVTTGLRQQFATEGNELERQYQLQSHMQKPGEKVAEYAGHLRVLADKAYPKWKYCETTSFRVFIPLPYNST